MVHRRIQGESGGEKKREKKNFHPAKLARIFPEEKCERLRGRSGKVIEVEPAGAAVDERALERACIGA